MPAHSTHPDYDLNLPAWLRARDVLAGENAVKAAGERYLPKLDSQSLDEFNAYKSRAAFFNATARTTDGSLGPIFRREPTIKIPEGNSGLAHALAEFCYLILHRDMVFGLCAGGLIAGWLLRPWSLGQRKGS